MSSGDERIEVRKTVERALDRRRRAEESYDDVLRRLLYLDRDLLAGFGAFVDTDRDESTQDVHERGERKPSERFTSASEGRERE